LSNDDLIEIGFIREAHGLRGQVVVHAYSGDENSLTQYGALQSADGSKRFTFDIINSKNNDFLCHVNDVSDRDAAEKLRGTKLFVPADALPPTNGDEYYVRDLIGLNIVDQKGTQLGSVINIHNLGHNDAFEIEFIHDGEKPLEKPRQEFLLYTTQNVLSVSVPDKKIIIDLPIGLLEDVKKDAH
jgi:16S rRNA processing protein RimM